MKNNPKWYMEFWDEEQPQVLKGILRWKTTSSDIRISEMKGNQKSYKEFWGKEQAQVVWGILI